MLRAYLFVQLSNEIARIRKFVESDLGQIERERNPFELKREKFRFS